MLVAGVAVLFSLTGGAYAAGTGLPSGSIGTLQLRNGAVTGAKLQRHSLLLSDFAVGQLPRLIRILRLRGPQGPPGHTGKPGPPGPAGETGPTGPSGASGPAGSQGSTGPAGASGAKGAIGATGPSGPPGLTGATGPAGPNGHLGNTGPAGPHGPAGAKGPAGTPGQTGATGPQGSPGLSDIMTVTVTHTIPDSAAVADELPCPSGFIATGGGGSIGTGPGAGLIIQQSVPIGPGGGPAVGGDAPTGWRVTLVNTSGATQPFSNYAICAKTP